MKRKFQQHRSALRVCRIIVSVHSILSFPASACLPPSPPFRNHNLWLQPDLLPIVGNSFYHPSNLRTVRPRIAHQFEFMSRISVFLDQTSGLLRIMWLGFECRVPSTCHNVAARISRPQDTKTQVLLKRILPLQKPLNRASVFS